jgi:hypothetical protein
MGNVECLDENAGNKKAGESEKEIHSAVSGSANFHQEIEETGTGAVIPPEEMVNENQKDGEPTNAVKSGDVDKATRIFLVGGVRSRWKSGWRIFWWDDGTGGKLNRWSGHVILGLRPFWG